MQVGCSTFSSNVNGSDGSIELVVKVVRVAGGSALTMADSSEMVCARHSLR